MAGLGWFDADVRRIEARRVPHIGWNDTTWRPGSPLFRGLGAAPHFYFVHSYQAVADDESLVHASCVYESPVTAALVHGNVAAVQFHPEKSQDEGIAVLTNFLAWAPEREATCSSAA